jgi:RNA-binding protein
MSRIRQLRSMAHHLKPVVQIGKNGLTEGVVAAIDEALDEHELIKIKFMDFKDDKKELGGVIIEKTGCIIVNVVGNIMILYRENPDETKRRIRV